MMKITKHPGLNTHATIGVFSNKIKSTRDIQIRNSTKEKQTLIFYNES